MVAILHSNRQLGTEKDGDTEKGCQNPALQQKTVGITFKNSISQHSKKITL